MNAIEEKIEAMRSRLEEIEKLRSRLEELDCGVVIFSIEDFASEEDFEANINTVLDVSRDRGFVAIYDMASTEED